MIARRTLLALTAIGFGISALRADDRPRGRPLPLSTILARVDARFQGRVLDADIRAGEDGKLVYEVRFLTDRGNLLQIRLDAGTGEFLDVEGHGFIDALKPGGR